MATNELSVADKVANSLLSDGKFANMLPQCYRVSAERWINRGKLYMLTSKNSNTLMKCTPTSILRSFLQAAENGIPIDGKMGYLVPYGDQCTFMASYIGLTSVARRHGLIEDAFSRVVREKDLFELTMTNGQFNVEFKPFIGDNPGEVIGAFTVLTFPKSSRVIADYMSKAEVEKVRDRSKAKNNGPWVTDWNEMAKKTVLRRTIKTYIDDPEVLALLDADDQQHGILDVEVDEATPRKVGARKAEPLRLEQDAPESTDEDPAPEAETSEPVDQVTYWKKQMLAETTKAGAAAVMAQAEDDNSMDNDQTALVRSHYEKIVKNLK
jgi:recombination protein RecT